MIKFVGKPQERMDTHSRSIAKAFTYRALGSLTTAMIFYVLSRDVTLAVGAGVLDALLKTAVYFLHERLWNHIPYGRQKPPEYEI